MNVEMATRTAKEFRKETIRELQNFIEDLQRDLDRLTKAEQDDTEQEGLTAIRGNSGFFLRQHCLRYEQTVTAGVKMEEWARLADWMTHFEKAN